MIYREFDFCRFVMIQLFFAAKWILISEVTFESGEKVYFSKLEPQVIFTGTLVLGRWEMHDEKTVSINTLLSYSRQQGTMIKGSTLAHTVQSPSKVSPGAQRVKLLPEKQPLIFLKFESHKKAPMLNTECCPLRNLGFKSTNISPHKRAKLYSRLTF